MGVNASFNNPVAMDVDRDRGFIYVSDNLNDRVRKIDIATSEVSTVATNIGLPMGIAFDSWASSPCLYVASNRDSVIYKITLDSVPVVSVFAGSKGL